MYLDPCSTSIKSGVLMAASLTVHASRSEILKKRLMGYQCPSGHEPESQTPTLPDVLHEI